MKADWGGGSGVAKSDWEIPHKLQPDPASYGFNLEQALNSVVSLKANAPADAFTASSLGTERAGSAVVIGDDGLVLTIGYLIMEVESIWLVTNDGRAIPGHALAFDQESGFGLVQPLGRLNVRPLPIGNSDAAREGDGAIFAAGGGRHHAIETTIVARHPFAGYWEYLLEDAIFTAPAHPFWGGAGLISTEGRLLGIGSLIQQQGDPHGRRLDRNMVVPISLLAPILDDLLTYGRVNRPPRPWLGLYAMENDDSLVVGGLADGGPAERAGIRTGDRIIAVGGEEVSDLGSLWRCIWAAGHAGAQVKLRIGRDSATLAITAISADRASFLRSPRMH